MTDGGGAARRVLGVLLLVIAAGVTAVAALAAYGLTKEYGYSPNDDPVADLTRTAITHVVVGVLVAGLVAGALELVTALPRRRRLLGAAGALVVVLVVLGVGTALGQRSLDQRCAGPERSSTGAC